MAVADVVGFTAAALMAALAAWLLWLKFESRVNRAFAFVLLLRAGALASGRIATLVSPPSAPPWAALQQHFLLPLVPATLYFVVAYVRPRGERAMRMGLVALAVLFQALYLFDHCLARCPGADGLVATGPLALLTLAPPLAYAVAAFALAHSSRSPARQRQSARIVATAFAVNAVLDAALGGASFAWFGLGEAFAIFEPSPWPPLGLALQALALVPALAAIVLVGRDLEPRRRPLLAATVAGAAVTGAATGSIPPLPESLGSAALTAIGAWRVLLVGAVAYALVRHHLFDIDVKLRWTIRRGTVVGAFILVFVVVETATSELLSNEYGPLAGGVAAALLLLAIGPLRRGADSFARSVFPESSVGEMGPKERIALYRAQLELAWTDGSLTRRERLLLDQLRERLGLGTEEAAMIEREILVLSARP